MVKKSCDKDKHIPKYESLFNGNVKEKIEIARQFKQNINMREKEKRVKIKDFLYHLNCTLYTG